MTPQRGADRDREAGGADTEGEWRFALDEVGEDAEPDPEPIEPEDVSLEHAAFVTLGVVLTLVVLATAL